MAHTKAIGSTKLGRDSIAKCLGVKMQDGQKIMVGQIIIRQRGTKYLPGENVLRGQDDTLYAGKNGIVKFAAKTKTRFDGSRRCATMVHVRDRF
jgi:large subunit ribosomal protein L27